MKKKKILVVIGIISIFVIPLTYAILKSSASDNKQLQAATFNVSLNQIGVDNYISIVAGDSTSSASYTVNVTSASEVDIIYSIVVDDIPSGVTVSLDNGSFETPLNSKVIFADVSTINYSDSNKTKSHTLTFKAASGATYTTDEEVNINVIARQLLSNE